LIRPPTFPGGPETFIEVKKQISQRYIGVAEFKQEAENKKQSRRQGGVSEPEAHSFQIWGCCYYS